jgi:hypothetical protein
MELWINGIECDVLSETIEIDRSIADINDLGARRGTVTKTIELPYTAKNIATFGYPVDVSAYEMLNNNTTNDAVIYDVCEVLRGKAKIMEVIRDKQINIIIYSDNSDWKTLLQNKLLKELDYSAYNHILNLSNILGTWSYDYPYLYPIVDFGKVATTLLPDLDRTLTTRLMYPAVQLRMLVEKMFQEIGYAIDSDIIDSAFFRRLYCYYPKRVTQNNNSTNRFIAGVSATYAITSDGDTTIAFDNDSTGGRYDNDGAYNTTTHIYTATCDPITNFKTAVKFRNNAANAVTFHLRILKQCLSGGTVQLATSETKTLTTGQTYTLSCETGNEHMITGESIYVQVSITEQATTVNLSVIASGSDLYSSSFWNVPSGNSYNSAGVDLQWMVPDVTCLEFLQAIKDKFNLYFEADTKLRRVRIETRDTFFGSSSVDLTQLLDRSKEIKFSFVDKPKRLIIQDKFDSSDGNLKKINDLFGQVTHDFDTVFSNSEKKIECLFAPTWMNYSANKGIYDIPIPTILKEPVNGNEWPEYSLDFEPRLLYYAGNATLSNSDYSETTIPECYSYKDSEYNTNNLLFSEQPRSNGCFQKYYRNEVKQINDSRMLAATFYLDQITYANLSFRNYALIDNDYYIINSIKSYKTNTGECTIELVLIASTAQLPAVLKEWEYPDIITPTGDTSIHPAVKGTINDITYDVLISAINTGRLTRGASYQMEYETIHRIKNTTVINTGTKEHLILFATSDHTISDQAWSVEHPNDVITYDYTKNLAEDGHTQRPGLITRRIDPNNDVDIPLDYQTYKSRRFAIDPAGTNYSGAPYTHNSGAYLPAEIAISAVDHKLYINMTGTNTATDPSLDTVNWIIFLDIVAYPHIFVGDGQIFCGYMNPICINNNDYADLLTFNGGTAKGVHIGVGGEDNVFFGDATVNLLSNNYSNTFINSGNGGFIKMGSNLDHYIISDCINIDFGDGSNSNIVVNSSFIRCVEWNIYNVIVDAWGDSLGSEMGANYLFSTQGNVLGIGTSFNVLTKSNNNKIGNNCNSNKYLSADNNTIGDNCDNNLFPALSKYNVLEGGNSKNIFCIGFKYNYVYPETLNGYDFTGATYVTGSYHKTIFKRSDGAVRLEYINAKDIRQIVNPTA